MGFGMGFLVCIKSSDKKKTPRNLTVSRDSSGAAIQIRTGDLILTKDVLYHLSHSSTKVRHRPQRPRTNYLATRNGLEPSTSSVTG